MKIHDQQSQNLHSIPLSFKNNLSLLSLLSISIVSFLLTSGLVSAGDPIVITRCQLNGTGELPNGDTMVSDIRDENGVALGSWIYRTSVGDEFVGAPSSFLCRINGSAVADVLGIGTWNGISGYDFVVHVQDHNFRPTDSVLVPGPPESQELSAVRTYKPSQWIDGNLNFPLGAQVTIPASLPVTMGNAGNQWTWLLFTRAVTGDPVRCMYRGGASTANPKESSDIALGQTVSLARCEQFNATGEWKQDPALTAGTQLGVTAINLHVQQGSTIYPTSDAAKTTVSINLEVTPNILQDRTDTVRFVVFDSTGAMVHFADGELITINTMNVTLMH